MEPYIEATNGFLTRIEVVDGRIALVVKRSVTASGLSSYHEGSTYELYPDCPAAVTDSVRKAASILDIQFGSFDVIESDEGLYLRTMDVKPFYRQLVEGGKLSVCGEKTAAPCSWDDDNMPHFQPGFMVRVSGDVRLLAPEEVAEKAAKNPQFNVAVYDINKYPETRVLVLHSAWGELHDYDFNMVHRDHKILRERFAWGAATFVAPGLSITDACIECGACAEACTHKAIVAGTPYAILGERCDECGNCYHVCPAGAVISKGMVRE